MICTLIICLLNLHPNGPINNLQLKRNFTFVYVFVMEIEMDATFEVKIINIIQYFRIIDVTYTYTLSICMYMFECMFL